MTNLDRASIATSGRIIDGFFELLPESKGPCAELLAADIDILSQEYPDRWGITLFHDRVRLNVGRVECVTLESRGLALLVLEGSALSTARRKATYKHAPGCVMIRMNLAEIEPELRALARSHRSAIRVAARYSTTPAIRNAHSNGVVGYLGRVVGRPLGTPAVNYWIVKGRPTDNPWEDILIPGERGTWYTSRRPPNLAKADRVFCWSSSPDRRPVGLAEVVRPDAGEDELGKKLFTIRYLTAKLSGSPGIEELRATPGLENASFLKSGPAATILRLTSEEGEALYSVLCQECENLGNVWPDLQLRVSIDFLEQDVAFTEGRRGFERHLRLERNRRIVQMKKRLARGRLLCAVCSFDFEKVYGIRGKDFCEVHHLVPLAENHGPVQTRMQDLSIVCANCHRMLHRDPWITVEELRSSLKSAN